MKSSAASEIYRRVNCEIKSKIKMSGFAWLQDRSGKVLRKLNFNSHYFGIITSSR